MPKPQVKPELQRPDHDTPKTGRDDGTQGQAGVGPESEDSPNPFARGEKTTRRKGREER
jgi:hypothetical protein